VKRLVTVDVLHTRYFEAAVADGKSQDNCQTPNLHERCQQTQIAWLQKKNKLPAWQQQEVKYWNLNDSIRISGAVLKYYYEELHFYYTDSHIIHEGDVMLHVSRAKLSSVNTNFIHLSLSLWEHYGGSERDIPSLSP
jgi:hypothetical protein